jgi:hypothetical protein
MCCVVSQWQKTKSAPLLPRWVLKARAESRSLIEPAPPFDVACAAAHFF